MINNSRTVRRLGIFAFYDKDGVVDDYITLLLKEMKPFLSELLVVVNGRLTLEGRQKLQGITKEILVRRNTGYDIWAYREGMRQYSDDQLREYDELILFNSSVMGPVNPFSEMFDEMDKRDLDFWGITKHYRFDHSSFEKSEYNYIPEHIQTFFVAVRRSMFDRPEFKSYWDELPEIDSYEDAISKHEIIFTKKFGDLGYKWDVYVNTDDIRNYANYPMLYATKTIVEKYNCPVFKRRMFFNDMFPVLCNSSPEDVAVFLEYLEKSGKYDTDLIWDNILRTCHQEDIVKNLNLRYILSTTYADEVRFEQIISTRKIALVLHIFFPDMIDRMFEYASNMPKEADIYITTDTKEKADKIEEVFGNMPGHKVEVRITENRGRDVSSLLIGVKDIVYRYDYICSACDDKASRLRPGTVAEGFIDRCFGNALFNETFVKNVICRFEREPRMGLLSTPGPNHAGCFRGYGNEWGADYEMCVELAEKLDIDVPMDINKMPIAPYGSVFWFRPEALRRLFDHEWRYGDFPEEPMADDGTITHAIARIYPFAAQAQGYYPAYLFSDVFWAVEYTNLEYYLEGMVDRFSSVFGRKVDIHGYIPELCYLGAKKAGIRNWKRDRKKAEEYRMIKDTAAFRMMNFIFRLFNGYQPRIKKPVMKMVGSVNDVIKHR